MKIEDLLPEDWEAKSREEEELEKAAWEWIRQGHHEGVREALEEPEGLDFNLYAQTRKDKYHEYLCSLEWMEKKSLKIEEAGRRCQLCNSPVNIDVHHRTYIRVPNEPLSDLTVLCHKCHDRFHTNHRSRWPSWNDINEDRIC